MADFNFYLNRQGVRGAKGDKGDQGYSPSISVGTNTPEEFTLIINNENETIETPNIKEGLVPEDRGGTYVRKDLETGMQYYGLANVGTTESVGEVQLASYDDLNNTDPEEESSEQPASGKAVEGLSARQYFASQADLNTVSSQVNKNTEDIAHNTQDIEDNAYNIQNIGNMANELESKVTTIQTDLTEAQGEVEALQTGKQNKLVEGDNITLVDNEDGTTTISSTGGGTGDVTAAGKNTFTGKNTFSQAIIGAFSSAVYNEITPAYYLGSGVSGTLPGYGYFNSSNSISSGYETKTRFELPDQAFYDIKSSDLLLTSARNIILRPGTLNGIPDLSPEDNTGTIKDKDGNVILSQGNVTPGDNITVEKTTDGIKISSTASGGGGDVYTDANNTFTGENTFNGNVTVTGEFGAVQADNTSGIAIYKDLTGQNVAFVAGEDLLSLECASTEVDENHGIQFLAGKPMTVKYTDSDTRQPVITQDMLVEGDNITLEKDITTGAVTISSTGGEAPSNMVTTDTAQTISGVKTFSNTIKSSLTTGDIFDGPTSAGTHLLKATISGTYSAGYSTDLYAGSYFKLRTGVNNGSTSGVYLIPNGGRVFIGDGSNASNPTFLALHKGNVTPGDGITITDNGTAGITISATSSGGTSDIATTETAGIVKPDGTTITVTEDGTISATTSLDTSNFVDLTSMQTIKGSKIFTGGLQASGVYINPADTERSITLINGGSSLNLFTTALTGGGNTEGKCWAVTKDLRYCPAVAPSLDGQIPEKVLQPYLRQGNITPGDGISIESVTDDKGIIRGIKISATEGDSVVYADKSNIFTEPNYFNSNITVAGTALFGSQETNYIYFNGGSLDASLSGGITLSAGNINLSTYGGLVNVTDLNTMNSEALLTGSLLQAGDGITIGVGDYEGQVKISATVDDNGMEGDYKVKYGIIDCPNGLITFSADSKDITVNQGIVLNCANNSNSKTTIASAINHTITTSSGDITLFYAAGELLECGEVYYSATEPESNGVENYQAWFNTNKRANPNQLWMFRSNDSGNFWRTVASATPIADMTISSVGVTSVRYMGYRVIDDDILVSKQESDYIANQSALSTVYEDITLAASGSTYTAPADGFFYIYYSYLSDNTINNPYISVTQDDYIIEERGHITNQVNPTTDGRMSRCFPIRKGDYKINYRLPTGTLNNASIRFYYLKGNEPTT